MKDLGQTLDIISNILQKYEKATINKVELINTNKAWINDDETLQSILSKGFFFYIREQLYSNDNGEFLVPNPNDSVEKVLNEARNNALQKVWIDILTSFFVNEDLLEKHIEEIPLVSLISTQKLSEGFIRKFKKELNWAFVSKFQDLTPEFIEEMSEYVSWPILFTSQKVSFDLLMKHKDKIKLTSSYIVSTLGGATFIGTNLLSTTTIRNANFDNVNLTGDLTAVTLFDGTNSTASIDTDGDITNEAAIG